MQFADLALGKGDELDARKSELLVERGHVLLVARQAVECLGDYHVELSIAGILKELLVARPKRGRT